MSRPKTDIARQTEETLREVLRLYQDTRQALRECCPGISGQECEALSLLGNAGQITVQEFADRMGLEKTWASRLAGRLEKQGQLRRVANPADGRSWLLELTPEGRSSCETFWESVSCCAGEFVSRIPAGRRSDVLDSLTLLRNALAHTAAKRGG